MPDKEVVLRLVCEGGGSDFHREKNAAGQWEIYEAGCSIDRDEKDKEIWHHWKRGPFKTLDQALYSLFPCGSWVLLSAVEVHPAYQARLWDLYLEEKPNFQADNGDCFQHTERYWLNACGYAQA